MMTHELRILDRSGDTKVTWNNNDPADRAKAREEIARLKAAGFLFFLIDGTPADEVAAGNGELLARFATDAELLGPEPEPVAADPPAVPEPDAPRKRGRKAGVPNKPKQAIAVPVMRGG